MTTKMPIDARMGDILDLIKSSTRMAISSDPGSGKSTRIPPALCDAGYRVLVLEPRRISALGLATYISECRNTKVGSEVGYQVRGDSKRSASTKCLFATEALLPKYLDADPFLSEWDVVILDEFHERHIHTDIAWALLNQIQTELRPELKLILLSATLNTSEIRRAWPDVAAMHITNPPHPLEIKYIEVAKSLSDPHAVRRALVETILSRRFEGDVLVFLPGYGEIQRSRTDLTSSPRLPRHCEVLELYGSQNLADQRAVLKKTDKQRIILATNVAESSITIDGVRTVIDCGLERVAWNNSKSGLSELKTQRISKSSATQRAGRAARQGPGECLRMWSEPEQNALDDFQVAEIHRSDLSEPLYSILSAGWDPLSDNFRWFEKPHANRLQDSLERLITLQLVNKERTLNTKYENLQSYPIGIRGGIYLSAVKNKTSLQSLDLNLAAWISEPTGRSPFDTQFLRDTEALARHLKISSPGHQHREPDLSQLSDAQIEALSLAIPDRFFERRSLESNSIKLNSGRGASLQIAHQSEIEKYGIAILMREADPDAIVSMAASIDKKQFQSIGAKPAAVQKPKVAQNILEAQLPAIDSLLQRAALYRACVQSDFEIESVLQNAAASLAESNPKKNLEALQGEILAWTQGMMSQKDWQRFEKACPRFYELPKSGRSVELKYVDTTRIELHARLQEFLHVKEHPTIAEGKVPLTLVLLSPAMRPIQITQRLQDFWTGSYIEIRKEMKARYPKHDW